VYNPLFTLCVLGKSCGFSSGSFSFANFVAKPKQRAIHKPLSVIKKNKVDESRKTIINSKGEILFFGLNQFKEDIAKGDCCFICGAKKSTKSFNDEHVIPDWVLKKYGLIVDKITLPNQHKFNYGRYKVPCCKNCNSTLGEVYEKPLSKLFSKPPEEVINQIIGSEELRQKIFIWLNLIFLKTHLKDKELRRNLDKRIDEGSIADQYCWEEIHHIHCISRVHYSKAIIEPNVFGSIVIFKVENSNDKSYDYIDSPAGKTVMIQLGQICIVSVLNDACACQSIMKDKFEKMYGNLSTFQIKEIVSHFNYLNLNLKTRPIFKSIIEMDLTYRIIAETPELWYLTATDERIAYYGKFLRFYLENNNEGIEFDEETLKEIELGNRSYLFDSEWNFLNQNEKEKN